MEHLFAYGTLMCDDIMREVAGFRPIPVPGTLRGYRRPWTVPSTSRTPTTFWRSAGDSLWALAIWMGTAIQVSLTQSWDFKSRRDSKVPILMSEQTSTETARLGWLRLSISCKRQRGYGGALAVSRRGTKGHIPRLGLVTTRLKHHPPSFDNDIARVTI